MLRKALHLLLHDRKALRWHLQMKWLHWRARKLANTGFQLQGKMDLSPLSWWHNPDFVAQCGGFLVPGDPVRRRVLDLEPWDQVRRDMIILLLRSLVERGVAGDLAELGVYKGSTARLIHHYLPDRHLHLFDTFTGFDERDVTSERGKTGLQTRPTHFSDTSVALVLNAIVPVNDMVSVYPGYFPASVPAALAQRPFAFVHLDADLYEPIRAGLEFFYPRIVPGGFLLVHDYNSWPGARKAVQEFFSSRPEIPIPMPDKSGSALVTKAFPGSGPHQGAALATTRTIP